MDLLNVKQQSRSKQKHSFNKDRQHSKRGRGRGGAERGGGEAGRGRGRGGGIVPENDEDDDEDSDEEGHNDTSKFRRRPVVEQTKQFELSEPVDDDEIPKLDIENLLRQPIKEVADAHFKFADENEWEYGGSSNTMIVIDCAQIAQKLKMLNISQRLDLDLSAFGEPALDQPDPLNIASTLKYITIHPESSPLPSSLLPSSSSSSLSSSSSSLQKHATPEDSFLDDLLNTTSTPPLPSSSSSLPSSSLLPSHSSSSLPSSSVLSSLPLSTKEEDKKTDEKKEEKKEEKKIEDATKASVGDLEDWLDSVI